MLNLSAEMADLWSSLVALGDTRVVQVIAARRGEGASTVARELADYAARRMGRSVWLIDLDLFGASQYSAISAASERFGGLGAPASASPDGSMFFTVQPAQQVTPGGRLRPDGEYLNAHRVGVSRWWVTRFRRDLMGPGQHVHVMPGSPYWSALREHADLIIVDSPTPDRSRAGLTIASAMDQTLLVVSAEQADVRAPAQLRDALSSAGGHVAGVFFNRQTAEAPGFLKALLP